MTAWEGRLEAERVGLVQDLDMRVETNEAGELVAMVRPTFASGWVSWSPETVLAASKVTS